MTSLRTWLLLGLFAALGVADYLLTAYLLRSSDGAVREANPVAAWLLARHGWVGLGAFKVATMIVVAALALLVGRYRPDLGRGVLAFACLAVAGVVLYSSGLLAWQRRPAARDPALAEVREEARRLESEIDRARAYRETVHQVSRELRDGRITLDQAVHSLGQSDQGGDSGWHRQLQAMFTPVQGRDPLLAVTLVKNALAQTGAVPDGDLGRRLCLDFQALYGQPLPESLSGYLRERTRLPVES